MDTAKTLHYGLLVMRIVLGIVMVAHGGQKLFTYGHAGVAGGFAQMGMPAPQVAAALIIAVEFLGGLMMLAGLFTRYVGAAFAFAMLVASVKVHLPNGFFMPAGYEFTLTLGAIALGLALTGAGLYSADAAMAGRRGRHPKTA